MLGRLLSAQRSFSVAALDAAVSASGTLKLDAKLRGKDGSRDSRKLRHGGQIPGIVYGPSPDCVGDWKDAVRVSVSDRALKKFYNMNPAACESTLVELEVEGGGSHLVTPFQWQIHPVSNAITSVNFLRYFPGRVIRLPLVYVNEERSPGLRRGGFIMHLRRTLEVKVDASAPIPKSLEVDLNGHVVGQSISSAQIKLPAGVTIVDRHRPHAPVKFKVVVATMLGKKAAPAAAEAPAAKK